MVGYQTRRRRSALDSPLPATVYAVGQISAVRIFQVSRFRHLLFVSLHVDSVDVDRPDADQWSIGSLIGWPVTKDSVCRSHSTLVNEVNLKCTNVLMLYDFYFVLSVQAVDLSLLDTEACGTETMSQQSWRTTSRAASNKHLLLFSCSSVFVDLKLDLKKKSPDPRLLKDHRCIKV